MFIKRCFFALRVFVIVWQMGVTTVVIYALYTSDYLPYLYMYADIYRAGARHIKLILRPFLGLHCPECAQNANE